jgi:hypothetical protein
MGRILRRAVQYAASHGAWFIGEEFIRDSHLDVVSLSRENQQRFVLRFPAEARDAAIVSAGVEGAPNAECCPAGGRGVEVVDQSLVGSRFNQTESEYRRGDAEDHVALRQRSSEVRLGQRAARRIRTPPDGIEIVHAAVRSAIRVLTNRASSIGPFGVTKDGTVFVAPSSVASAICGLVIAFCGLFSPGLLPPGAGWA